MVTATLTRDESTIVVDSFNTIPLSSVEPKWSRYCIAMVCPECEDNKGHAGVFPRENMHSQLLVDNAGQYIPGYIGHCLKCDQAFILRNRGADFDPSEAKVSHNSFNYRKASEQLGGYREEHEEPDYSRLDREYRLINFHLSRHIANSREGTCNILRLRGYSEGFISYLLSQGFGLYDKPDVAYSTPEGYHRMPCFRKENAVNGSYLSVFYPITFQGLLIPLHRDGKIIGQRVRSIVETGPKYRPLAIPSKYLSEKQRKEYFMPVYTLLNTDLPEDEETNSNGDFMICEGELKAHTLKYHFKKMVMGVCGVNNFNNEKVRRILFKYATRTLVIVPDRDYTSNYAVANNTWKLIQWATDCGFRVRILEWGHPDANVRKSLKGVDDAIIRANTDDTVSFNYISRYEFFAKMYTKVRQKTLKDTAGKGFSVGQVITPEELATLTEAGVVERDDTVVLAVPDLEYLVEDRLSTHYQALAQHKLVVDLSPTGSGKSHAVGYYEIKEINGFMERFRLASVIKGKTKAKSEQLTLGNILEEVNISMKAKKVNPEELALYEKAMKENTIRRVIHISQSPMNSTVKSINVKFALRIGRNAHGWIKDLVTGKMRAARPDESPLFQPNCPQADNLITLRDQRQVIEIQKDICTKCPLRAGCVYLKAINKLSHEPFIMQSFQSLSVKTGDLIIFDDFGGQEHFITLKVDHTDISTLFKILDHRPKWKKEALLVKDLVSKVLKTVKAGKRGHELYKEMFVSGELKKYSIPKWLSMDEPDRIPTQMIKLRTSGAMEFGEEYIEFKNMKRWFFMFLQVLQGGIDGDIFYDNKSQSWGIKGVDPKYRDIYKTAAAVLVLDATANRDYIKLIFGADPYIISSPGDPFANIKVKQIVGFQNTHKSSINFRGGQETIAKIDWITEDIRSRSRTAGVITFKSLFDHAPFADKWDTGITKGWWFFSERASNEYYDNGVNSLYLMGVPIPNLTATAAEIDGDGDISTVWVARPWGPVKEDGTRDYVIMKDVSNTNLRNLLWYKRCASYIQAAGRLRSLRREKSDDLELVIMDNIALPFKVDEVINVRPEAKKEMVTMASNLLFRRVSFLQGVYNALVKFGLKYGEVLTKDNLDKLQGQIDFNVLSNLGIKIGNCSSITAMVNVIERRMTAFNNNPSLLDEAVEDTGHLTRWFNSGKNSA